jgi:uncharacterized protein YdaU (DUF1376 family)
LKPPAFQLYAADFYMDTVGWTATEVGVYFRLLMHEWINGPLPANNSALARIGGIDHRNMQKMWSVVLAKKFTVDDAGMYINERLEKTRKEQTNYSESQRLKGKKRAEQRWEGHIAVATKRLQPKDSSSSSTSSSIKNKRQKIKDIVPKILFGHFVKLTQKEYDQFIIEWGVDKLTDAIMKLDYSINTGKKYADHNMTLRNWDRRGYLEGGSNGNGKREQGTVTHAASARFGDGNAYPIDIEVNE